MVRLLYAFVVSFRYYISYMLYVSQSYFMNKFVNIYGVRTQVTTSK